MTLSFLKRRPVLIGLLILMIAVAFLTTRKRPPAAVIEKPAQVLEFLTSDIVMTTVEPLRQVLPMSGALRALNQVSVKAKVAGEVKEVLVRAGEAVQAGQVLIRIDTSEYQAKLEQARGSLVASRGQLDIATKTRDNNLALLDKGFISRNAFDNAASQFDIAKANVDTARGALDVAQKALNDTVIKAPINGMISSRTVEPGEKVSIDNKLLDVVDLSQMELEAPVPTADILKVKLGQEVLVTVEGLPQAVVGKVVRINPGTQSGSRSIMVYVRIENPQGLLRAGMFADASLTLDKRDAVMTVPQTSIQTDGDKTYVYAIEEGKLIRRDVTLGMRGIDSRGNAVEVSSGLQNGARIVKANLGNLNTGTPVRISATGGAVPAATNVAPATSAPAVKAKE
ncbi:efflux RND transporter periplasmic adaptor subunit [Herbaspirillum rhizosphaerae]|uniref:Efflux RND transporter periplasmic adaptor subunit n=1 Tax=Herbaspirillum rhizosphaerae TaxID=346179 RepID=A0ABW8ZFL8_9BURK